MDGFTINKPPPVSPCNAHWNQSTVQSNSNSKLSSNVLTNNNNNNNNSNPFTLNINKQIENINIQQKSLREQILQSEANLTAQHQVNGIPLISVYIIYNNKCLRQITIMMAQFTHIYLLNI